VKEDTGTDVNWISPRVVGYFDFDILDAPVDGEYCDFRGNTFHPVGMVNIPLAGMKSRTEYTECHIAPEDFPFDGVLVGTRFVQRTGHIDTVFPDRPDGTALIIMQKKVTVGKTYTADGNL